MLWIKLKSPAFRIHRSDLSYIVAVSDAVVTVWGIGKELNSIAVASEGQKLNAVFVHTGNDTVTRSSESLCLIHLKELQHELFIGLTLAHQLSVGRCVAGICQLHKGISRVYGVTLADFNGFDCTCIGSCVPWAIDIKLCRAHLSSVFGADSYFFARDVSLVLYGDGHFTGKVFNDPGAYDAAVREAHIHGVPHFQFGIHSDIGRHKAVEAQYSQSAVLQHYVLNGSPFLSIEDLDGAAGKGSDLTLCFFFTFGLYLLSQIVQGLLNFGDGCHDGHSVKGGDGIALFYIFAVGYEILRQFDRGVNGYRDGILLGKSTASDKFGVYTAGLSSTGKDTCCRAVSFLFLSCHQGHGGKQNYYSHDAHKGNNSFYLLIFSFTHGLILHNAAHRSASSWLPCLRGKDQRRLR